jgi:hypothetical protein
MGDIRMMLPIVLDMVGKKEQGIRVKKGRRVHE